MAQEEEVLKAFVDLGLSEDKAKETFKNVNVTKTLYFLINQVRQDTF